jgi:hypothetical protein
VNLDQKPVVSLRPIDSLHQFERRRLEHLGDRACCALLVLAFVAFVLVLGPHMLQILANFAILAR